MAVCYVWCWQQLINSSPPSQPVSNYYSYSYSYSNTTTTPNPTTTAITTAASATAAPLMPLIHLPKRDVVNKQLTAGASKWILIPWHNLTEISYCYTVASRDTSKMAAASRCTYNRHGLTWRKEWGKGRRQCNSCSKMCTQCLTAGSVTVCGVQWSCNDEEMLCRVRLTGFTQLLHIDSVSSKTCVTSRVVQHTICFICSIAACLYITMATYHWPSVTRFTDCITHVSYHFIPAHNTRQSADKGFTHCCRLCDWIQCNMLLHAS